MTDMTPTTDLQKLLAEATKGPWRVRIGTRDDQDTCDIQICGDIYVLADLNGPQYAHQHPNARLIAMAPDLAARVIELEAENARLREDTRRDTLADAVRACQIYVEWCQNWGRHDNLLAAMDAANEIAEMLPTLPEIRHIEDDEEAARAIYSINPKWIAEQAKARAALKGGEK